MIAFWLLVVLGAVVLWLSLAPLYKFVGMWITGIWKYISEMMNK